MFYNWCSSWPGCSTVINNANFISEMWLIILLPCLCNLSSRVHWRAGPGCWGFRLLLARWQRAQPMRTGYMCLLIYIRRRGLSKAGCYCMNFGVCMLHSCLCHGNILRIIRDIFIWELYMGCLRFVLSSDRLSVSILVIVCGYSSCFKR